MKHIYMGEGKGKTTAAVGLSIRCAGSGKKVLYTEFMKTGQSGELEILSDLDQVQLWLCPAQFGFSWKMSEKDKEEARQVYARYLWDIERMVIQGNFDMLVMDEVIAAVHAGLLSEDEFWETVEQFDEDLEIVLTGRYPTERMLSWADYITEMKKIKHPYDKGVLARKGIEY